MPNECCSIIFFICIHDNWTDLTKLLTPNCIAFIGWFYPWHSWHWIEVNIWWSAIFRWSILLDTYMNSSVSTWTFSHMKVFTIYFIQIVSRIVLHNTCLIVCHLKCPSSNTENASFKFKVNETICFQEHELFTTDHIQISIAIPVVNS